MADSRSKNAKRNVLWAIVNRLITLLMQFFSRTVFIYYLGELYLGLNSLFASTLNFLALAELGVGGALIFSMYKPLAEGEYKTVCALLNLYRKIYRIIGCVMLFIGLVLMLFIPYLINGDVPNHINVYLVFFIFLINTVLSYFLYAYKSSLLIADQRSDINSNIASILSIFSNLCQILVLCTLKNYYYYCLVTTCFTIANNLIINYVVNKRYPQFKCFGSISKEQLNDIKKRVVGLFIYKVCYVFRDAIDAIFISAFIGLSILGKYNNYMFVINTITGFLLIARTSITASIGNSLAKESEEKNYNDFNKCQLLYMWISIWCTVCLYCLLQPFIKLWIGKHYLLGNIELILFCIFFLTHKLGDICSTYRQAAGLWWQDKHRPIVEALVKTILNLTIIKLWGVAGALGGSIICLLLINSIWASWVLYRYYFKNHKQIEYIKRNIYYLLITFVICIVSGFVCSLLPDDGKLPFIEKCLICLILPNFMLWLLFKLLPEFNSSIVMLRSVIKA